MYRTGAPAQGGAAVRAGRDRGRYACHISVMCAGKRRIAVN
jgi:hypothetical protein